MDDHPSSGDDNQKSGFKGYVAKRLIVAALIIILVVWAFGSAPKAPDPENNQAKGAPQTEKHSPEADMAHTPGRVAAQDATTTKGDLPHSDTESAPKPEETASPSGSTHQSIVAAKPQTDHAAGQHEGIAKSADQQKDATIYAETPSKDSHQAPRPHSDVKPQGEKHSDGGDSHGAAPAEPSYEDLPTGVAFVEATIASIDHELNKRFWGWRPNDIVNFTDNMNNFQLGVLEVTRRTVVLLAERISRTGTTDAFNPHLENAMNWLMVKASRYWFPAPESKYKESIEELAAYKEELLAGRGSFYTRTDNLIPLLSSYEDLLGSCDENLVKQQNEDGSDVSLLKADDYFYYAQGVASTMATILEAIHHDFHKTLESRHATELLHHALESCRQAAALDPLLITNGDLDGILANHRANMAAPISHARFYIGQLIKTLST